jgi:hypothetical protein
MHSFRLSGRGASNIISYFILLSNKQRSQEINPLLAEVSCAQ